MTPPSTPRSKLGGHRWTGGRAAHARRRCGPADRERCANVLNLLELGGDHYGVRLLKLLACRLLIIVIALVLIGVAMLGAEHVVTMALEAGEPDLLAAREAARRVLLDLARLGRGGDHGGGDRGNRDAGGGDDGGDGLRHDGFGVDGLRVGPLVFAEALGAHVHSGGRAEEAAALGTRRRRGRRGTLDLVVCHWGRLERVGFCEARRARGALVGGASAAGRRERDEWHRVGRRGRLGGKATGDFSLVGGGVRASQRVVGWVLSGRAQAAWTCCADAGRR